jgi:hypothetical protein
MKGRLRAFSSEVATGSRQETRQIKNLEPRFDSIETEKALVGRLLHFKVLTGT